MESYLERDLTGEARGATVGLKHDAVVDVWLDPPEGEVEQGEDMGRDDIQHDPFLACPPEIDEFPTEALLVEERRHATTVLKQLLASGEYARIPLWIALEHTDLVRRVFSPLKRGVGPAATTQPWAGAERLDYNHPPKD